ncbi:MAG: glycosyltransferase, partial [Oscillospiraceae bacterium]|nr:glycosyltransferase [Oscillospiraceae bacterium]
EMSVPFLSMDEPGLHAFIDRAVQISGDRGQLRENVRRLTQMERRNVETVRRLYASGEPPGQAPLKRIAIFQSDLRVGGIQKALVNILNAIDYTRCTVDLYLFERGGVFTLMEHPNLRVRYLPPYLYTNRLTYFGLLRRFKKAPGGGRVYDVAVDFSSYRNECAVGALGVPAGKRVMWIHNDVEIKLKNEIKYKILWHFFGRKFQGFDEFCAVSPGVIDGFRRASGIADKRVTAISNTIDTAEIFRKAEEPVDFAVDPACYNLCTMGRICHQKGFDLLMEHIARAAPRRPDLRLYLLGDGPDREKLERQIGELGLGGVVTLLGNQPNPFPYLRQMDGFTLTSRYEGQGIVIWEAKALGLELFISRNLEKYNPGIEGVDDVAEALLTARRREKVYDDLSAYNRRIRESLFEVLEIH